MTRKLAAILAADVVGYSRMIATDETATVTALKTLRAEVFGPVFAAQNGRIVKSMGDGWLVEFASAVEAVTAAMQVQDRLQGHDRIRLRIGIHIGDVTRTEDDIYGDGINIAARLEGLAPEGGVLISDAVYASLDGTLSPSFEAAGEQALKNIDRKVVTWVRGTLPSETGRSRAAPMAISGLPHLTIQPVGNTDPRAELQDLADALTADLETYFGSINWLQSTVSSTTDVHGYSLRPTLRARGERMRLEVRLQDPDGTTIWTHKSDSTLDDSFEWQDSVVAAVADHCLGMILEAETTRIAAIPDDDLTAEQCMLMGIQAWRDFSRAAFVQSVQFHERAIAAKPDLPDPYAEGLIVLMAARTMSSEPDIVRLLQKVPDWVEAGKPLSAGHAMLTLAIAIATYMVDKRPIPLKQAVAQCLRLAPFDARILSYCGWANLWSGATQDAYDCFHKSLGFGQLGPFYVASLGGIATACIQLGRDEDALSYVEKGLTLSDSYATYFSSRSAALAHLGRMEEARTAMKRYRELEPERTLATWQSANNYGGSEGGKRYFKLLQLAGLPEA
jgi:adenylate cyclase